MYGQMENWFILHPTLEWKSAHRVIRKHPQTLSHAFHNTKEEKRTKNYWQTFVGQHLSHNRNRTQLQMVLTLLFKDSQHSRL